MQEILDFLQSLDWSPLVISIKTGIVATILSFFFGIFAARAVMKLRPGARAVIDGFLTLPMILPPTVAGFFLLLIFSLRRPFGAALYENFSIKAVQTWLGCILAATIIAFPLMYRNTRAAFEQVDTNLIYAARTLGMSEWKIFWKVVIPSAGPGVLSGTVLAFARALGEYGATSMLAGSFLDRVNSASPSGLERKDEVSPDGISSSVVVTGSWISETTFRIRFSASCGIAGQSLMFGPNWISTDGSATPLLSKTRFS